MSWLRLSEWSLSDSSVYVIIVAALVIIAARWPLRVHLAGTIDAFGLNAYFSLTMLFGRFAVRTARSDDGRVEAALELSLFHLLPIRRRVVSGPPSEAKPHGTGPDLDSGPNTKTDSGPSDETNSNTGTNINPGTEQGDHQRESASPWSAPESDTAHLADGNVLRVWSLVRERWWPVARGLWRGTRYVLRRVRMRQLQVEGYVGLGDPARTAQAYGALWALVGVFGTMLQREMTVERHPNIKVMPVYNQWVFRGQGEASLTIRLGDALLGALVALREFFRRPAQRGAMPDEGLKGRFASG